MDQSPTTQGSPDLPAVVDHRRGNDAVSSEAALLEQALFEVKKVIVGQDRAIERLLVCLLARGHCLLEGVPGLAKTLAAETLARGVGGTFTRMQFTPDLLPADIIGTRIYRASTETFDVELGPVFANFVLADEINRAPAKVQSALLEVMAEHQVSIGGRRSTVPPAVPRAGHPEPDRVRGRLPAARGPARPLPHEDRASTTRRRPRRSRSSSAWACTPPRAVEVLALDDLRRAAAGRRAGLRRPQRRRLRRQPGAAPPATPENYGLAELRTSSSYGASPRRASASSPAAGPSPCSAAAPTLLPQDVFDVAPDDPAPPPRALLRGARPGHRRRPGPRPHPVDGAGAARQPVAARCAHRCLPPGPARRAALAAPDRGGRTVRHPRSRRRTPGRRGPAPARPRRHPTLDGLLQGDYQGLVPGTAPSPARPAPTSRATTSAASTGTSPPACRRRTSARRSPTASSRPGCWSTARQPRLRHGVVREARPRPRRIGGRRLPHRPGRQPRRRDAPARHRPGDRAAPSGPTDTCSPSSTACSPHPARTGGDRATCGLGLRRVGSMAPRRGLVVVISDFLADPDTWRMPLGPAGAPPRRAVRRGRRPPRAGAAAVGVLHLVDPATGATREVNTDDRRLRARYADAAARQHAAIAGASDRRAPTTSCCAPTATGCWTSCGSSPVVGTVQR